MKRIFYVALMLMPLLVAAQAVFVSARAQNIVQAEYFFDTDPGLGLATPIAVTPAPDATINFTADLTSISGGFHSLYVRAKDANGLWSLLYAKPFLKETTSPVLPNITAAEYFIDTDPGFGAGTPIAVTPGADVSPGFTVNLSAVSSGFHLLYVRAKDANGAWSLLYAKPFINEGSAGTTPNIVQAEYFFDTDPGFGAATPIAITAGADVSPSFTASLSSLTGGFHLMYVRAKDANGQWSLLYAKPFINESSEPVPPSITSVEYFFAKRGVAGGTQTFNSFAPTIDATISTSLNLSGLARDSTYELHIYGKNALGVRGLEYVHSFTLSAWIAVSVGSNTTLGGIAASDSTVIAVGDSAKIFRTTNSGSTWTQQTVGTNALRAVTVAPNLQLQKSSTPTAFGTAISCGVGGTILKSTNGGEGWTPVSSGTTNTLNAIASTRNLDSVTQSVTTNSAASPNAFGTAISCGVGGTILRSTNGGDSWTSVSSPTSAELTAIALADDVSQAARGGSSQTPSAFGTAISCGVGGTILRSTDGGQSWTSVSSPTSNRLNAVAYFGASQAARGGSSQTPSAFGTAISCGVGGTILRSTDGGQNWTSITGVTTKDLNSVAFATADTAYISGADGFIFRSTNAGLTWSQQQTTVINNFNSIVVLPSGQGYAAGANGTVLVRGGEARLSAETEPRPLPKQFSLSQNYPNPFNPATVILYQVPAASDVKLKIYDVLGREVQTLVDERKAPGEYQVRFEASRLSSGIYFYRLQVRSSSSQTKDFVETKKMILVK